MQAVFPLGWGVQGDFLAYIAGLVHEVPKGEPWMIFEQGNHEMLQEV